MSKSTESATKRKASTEKPKKPRPDFPLFPHGSGRWCKKVRGKFHYFGKVADDPKGERALELWLEQRDDLLAGRTPRPAAEGLTVKDLLNRFLTAKQHQLDCGEITPRTFLDYKLVCDRLVKVFGKTRLVSDLAAEDFERLRADIAKTRGPVSLGNEVQRIRVVFKYGYDAGLYDKPIRYGPTFKRPSKKVLRQQRNKNGARMFESHELRRIIEAADVQVKAMVSLAINAALGNTDIGALTFRHLDLNRGWLTFPRPKTGIERRCPLWPETIEALKAAIAERHEPKNEDDADLVFITKYRSGWNKDSSANPISAEFRKLLQAIDEAAEKQAKKAKTGPPAKLYRKGCGFYAIRHTFRTVADATRDFPALDLIMGHVDDSMADRYRERIEDDRLQAVVSHVRAWLFRGEREGVESNESNGQ
jgi:integrase